MDRKQEAGGDAAFNDEKVAIDEIVADDGTVMKAEAEEVATEDSAATETTQADEPNKVAVTNEPKKAKKVKRCKTSCWPAVVILALLAVAAAGFGVWAVWSNQEKISKLEEKLDAKDKVIVELGGEIEDIEEKPSDQPTDLAWKSMALTRANWINPWEGDGFRVSLHASLYDSDIVSVTVENGLVLACEDDEDTGEMVSKVYLTVDWDKLREMYDINNALAGAWVSGDFDVSGIDASQVVDVLIVAFGQGVGSETVLFQMADGTIEYIPLIGIAKDGKVKSYGKLPGVENVVRMMSSRNRETYITVPACYGGGMNAYAQRNDGKFYTLYPLLQATGSYDI